PQNDKAAQQDIKPPPKDVQSTQTDKGQKADVQFIHPKPPADATDVKIVQQPKDDKGGVVFQIGVDIYINNPQQTRDRLYNPNHGDQIYYEDLSRGRTRETITRKDGSKVVTIYAQNGDVLQRSKITPQGREIILSSYDPRDTDENDWQDPGDDLPPLQLNIPADQYTLDADTADQNQVDDFLNKPPVEQVQRIYTIDEVKRSARLRDMLPRLEIGNLTFDTAKATISRDQVGALAGVAKGMQDLLNRNPAEVFLVEGHTDAVGSDVSNLVLSDQRAATVARILTDFYEIPAENLVTQGYGERYLKVDTQGPEPLNRRVTIKRITPLIAYNE
ncbi:MAG TPA: OmpA family protein, partial [Devosia sp.]|nr:OmpA family protein [Devosia sp.]